MATTYKLIDKAILTGTQGSITFTGLGSYSSDYTDLLVRISSRNTNTDEGAFCRFNSDSGTNYEWIQLKGTGSSAVSNKAVSFGSPYTTGVYWRSSISSQTSNTFASTDIYIPNFSSSNYKSVNVDSVTENNATAAEAAMIAGLWKNTNAITSITFVTEGVGYFETYSGFYLYGIRNS